MEIFVCKSSALPETEAVLTVQEAYSKSKRGMVLRSLPFQKLFSPLHETSFQNGRNLKISSVKTIVFPNPHGEHQDFVAEIKFKKKRKFLLKILNTFLHTENSNRFLATG